MIKIPLRDKSGKIVAYSLIDDDDAELASRRWYRAKNGYAVCSIRPWKGVRRHTSLYLHVAVMGGKGVDHINGNRLDNRKSNLRFATQSENLQNRLVDGKRSLPRGVYKSRERFMARARKDGKVHHLGVFDTPEEADAVVKKWRAENMPFSADARAKEQVTRKREFVRE